ncbi:Betaine aldehyde dehydrogenase [Bacillus amyloliquefaciens]|nr:Betaine aldehyde dehydrogenase [Bacillus amyloliquefaciens]
MSKTLYIGGGWISAEKNRPAVSLIHLIKKKLQRYAKEIGTMR